MSVLPPSSRSRSRSSGHGSTCRATKSSPSSVSTSRTAEENGHHSAWYRVSAGSGIELRLLAAGLERERRAAGHLSFDLVGRRRGGVDPRPPLRVEDGR